jgi:hypothetical protein
MTSQPNSGGNGSEKKEPKVYPWMFVIAVCLVLLGVFGIATKDGLIFGASIPGAIAFFVLWLIMWRFGI